MLLLPRVGSGIACGLNTVWEVFAIVLSRMLGEDEGEEDELL